MRYLTRALVLITTLVAPMMAKPDEQEEISVTGTVESGTPPDDKPPPPPAVLPTPPTEPQKSPPPRQAPADTGQWVHTAQYGWVWMPYGDDYTNAPRGWFNSQHVCVLPGLWVVLV